MGSKNNSLHKPVVLECWTDIGDILQDVAVRACKREAIKHPLTFMWEDTHEPHLKDVDLLLRNGQTHRYIQVELKKIRRRLTAWDIRNWVLPRFNGQDDKVLIHSSSLTTGGERLCRENNVKVFCVNYDVEKHNAVLLLQQIVYDLTKYVLTAMRAYVCPKDDAETTNPERHL